MAGPGIELTVSAKRADAELFAASFIVTVKSNVPVALGTPLMTPVEPLSASPAGKPPPVIDQV